MVGLLSFTYVSRAGVNIRLLIPGEAVEVEVCVGVGVWGVTEGVSGVRVGVAVAVSNVGEAVIVLVGVYEDVGIVKVGVRVGVYGAVLVCVLVRAVVGVREGVSVGPASVSTIRRGAFAADSRLPRLISVELAPVRTMLNVPFPVI